MWARVVLSASINLGTAWAVLAAGGPMGAISPGPEIAVQSRSIHVENLAPAVCPECGSATSESACAAGQSPEFQRLRESAADPRCGNKHRVHPPRLRVLSGRRTADTPGDGSLPTRLGAARHALQGLPISDASTRLEGLRFSTISTIGRSAPPALKPKNASPG